VTGPDNVWRVDVLSSQVHADKKQEQEQRHVFKYDWEKMAGEETGVDCISSGRDTEEKCAGLDNTNGLKMRRRRREWWFWPVFAGDSCCCGGGDGLGFEGRRARR